MKATNDFTVKLFYKNTILDFERLKSLLQGIAVKHGGKISRSEKFLSGRNFQAKFTEKSQVKKFLTYLRMIRKPTTVDVVFTKVEKVTRNVTAEFRKRKSIK